MKKKKHTNKIDNAVCNTQRASSLNTATDILDLGLELLASFGALKLSEESLRESSEASHDIAANELLSLIDITLLRDLNLQLAAAEAEIEKLLDTGLLAFRERGIMLGDLVAASNTQVDAALAHEGRDVGGGQEDECDRQVLDQRDVEAGLATELDVTAGQEVESGLLQAALCGENARLVRAFCHISLCA